MQDDFEVTLFYYIKHRNLSYNWIIQVISYKVRVFYHEIDQEIQHVTKFAYEKDFPLNIMLCIMIFP